MLFKNTCFEPSFPKIKIFKQLSLNSQMATCFAQNSRNFQTWLAKPKSHIITCTKFSKE